jgi:hypothetical protein
VTGELNNGLLYGAVPGPLLFFTQIAGLFTEAKQADVDFRAQGWSCRDGLFREIDIDPFFPIQAGNKENRFQRAVYFYAHNHKVMRQLDRFLVSRYNASVKAMATVADADAVGRIGGVRILSAATPIPSPQAGVQRYQRKSLDAYPPDKLRTLYETPSKRIWESCRESG